MGTYLPDEAAQADKKVQPVPVEVAAHEEKPRRAAAKTQVGGILPQPQLRWSRVAD